MKNFKITVLVIKAVVIIASGLLITFALGFIAIVILGIAFSVMLASK